MATIVGATTSSLLLRARSRPSAPANNIKAGEKTRQRQKQQVSSTKPLTAVIEVGCRRFKGRSPCRVKEQQEESHQIHK